MDKVDMCQTGVIHVWLYVFIPKVIGSRFRVQGSSLPWRDLICILGTIAWNAAPEVSKL